MNIPVHTDDIEEIVVSWTGEGKRLDLFLSKRFPSFSRHFWTKLIRSGAVGLRREGLSSGKPVPSRKLMERDIITIDRKLVRGNEPQWTYEKTIPVLYEDENLVAVNKPAGLLTHPAGLFGSGSLIDIIEKTYGHLHICGRLDRFTSGIVLLARSSKGLTLMDEASEKRIIGKEYLALTCGVPQPKEGTLTYPIGSDDQSSILLKMAVTENGKASTTSYRVLFQDGERALVLCKLETGRKHQIRVHLAHIGCPVVNDKLYSKNIDYDYFQPGRGNLHSYWPSWHGLHCYQMTVPARVFHTEKDLIIRCLPGEEMGKELSRLLPPDSVIL